MQNSKLLEQKKTVLFFIILSMCLFLVYTCVLLISTNNEILYVVNTTDFLVYSSRCKIPNIDPFNNEVKRLYKKEKYVPCSKLDPLTYVTKDSNGTRAVLHVDMHLIPSYSKNGIACCVSNITREPWNSTRTIDNYIHTSKCVDFELNVSLPELPVIVRCKNSRTKKEIYSNAYDPVTLRAPVLKKVEHFDKSTRPLSVLMVGVDSISRLNMIRVMPLTRGHLEDNGWLEMQGYNKMGDNTFPNLMAILTGKNNSEAYNVCDPKTRGKLDKCNFVWFDYNRTGYTTGYAEDHGPISTFNYVKKGFDKRPVDFYFRPYVLASEQLKSTMVDQLVYCTGPVSSSERILNAARDFAVTLKNVPNFGFFWMNFAHNKLNSGTRFDFKLKKFFEDLKSKGILENSVVIFLSDHGLRFGKILYTYTGWLEERLPFLYIWVPQWFRELFPLEYENMRLNANKLTNPYDLHMTLQDILVYSGRNHTLKPSSGCPNCRSLFSEIPQERSCVDSSIDFHWCSCTNYKFIDKKNATVQSAAEHLVEHIQETLTSRKEAKKCAKYKLSHVISSRLSDDPVEGKPAVHLLIIMETTPSAVFEGTVHLEASTGKFTVLSGISRLDYYKPHSKCTEDAYLKTLCYCHK